MHISSLQNGRVKNVVKLRQRRHRDLQRLTVVEGAREVVRALQSDVIPVEAFVCSELITGEEAETAVSLPHQLAPTHSTQLFHVTPDVFAKMAYRENSGGLLLTIPYLTHTLDDLLNAQTASPTPPLLVIIESVEKPGNLGAILRTADAVGVDGVILSSDKIEGSTDLHNPNVIRTSLGTLFTVPVVTVTNDEALAWIRQQAIQIVATTPAATAPYTAVPLTGPVAIVMGSEAHGLSNKWLTAANTQVMIPMHGIADSLNLSVATAVLLYEVIRQRVK